MKFYIETDDPFKFPGEQLSCWLVGDKRVSPWFLSSHISALQWIYENYPDDLDKAVLVTTKHDHKYF